MKPMSRGTFRVNDFTAWSKGLTVTTTGDAVISHAGAAALRLTADRTGLTTALSHVLRHQCDLLGEVASPATVSRALAEVDPATLARMDAARAEVRARVWDLIVARPGRIPPARVPTGDLGDQIVLRIGTGRPLARCLSDRSFSSGPRPEPDVIVSDHHGSPVTTPWVSRLVSGRGWCRGRRRTPRGSCVAVSP